VSKLIIQRQRLQGRFTQLAAAKKARALDDRGVEALAECAFRLAVHADTPPGEASRLLRLSCRIDGANPKFAYHLARLYFSHGDFDRAASWLENTICGCPTSHRLWTHVSLLQRELDRRYEDNTQYRPHDLLNRSREITDRVKQGNDSFSAELLAFKPAAVASSTVKSGRLTSSSPASFTENQELEPTGAGSQVLSGRPRRILDAGRCRWTGVYDLLIEQMLETIPSQSGVNRVTPMLEYVAAQVKNGRRPASSFAVLAVQWLVCGYPLDIILRLRREIGRDDSPSLQLLDLVCRLSQSGDDTLAASIQKHVIEKRLPPLLAAVLHQRRLAPPVSLPGAASKLSAANRLIAGLKRNIPVDTEALGAINRQAGQLASAIDETNGQLTTRQSMVNVVLPDRVDELEKLAAEINRQLKLYWEILEKIEKVKAERALNKAEIDELQDIKQKVEEKGAYIRNGLKKLEEIQKAGGLEDADAVHHLAKVVKDFQSLNLGRFRKVNELMRSEALSISPSPAGQPDPSRSQEIAALGSSVSRLESQINNTYQKAISSFSNYSPQVLAQPPFITLLMSTRARWADNLYRSGKHAAARKIWNSLLCEDRLNINLLKNIAVCDSHGPDMGQTLASWKAYIEMLYFYDIVGGNPKPKAALRAGFHRHFGNAYAPASLRRPARTQEQRESGEEALFVFLNSPSRVRNFVDHKLLEFFNARLDFSSPPLILGIRRTDSEKARVTAAGKMQDYAQNTCSLLPRRVSDAFTVTAVNYIKVASDACTSKTRLLLKKDSRYFQEVARHEAWTKETCEFKRNILVAIDGSKELPAQIRSIDFLEQLSRLDSVPIDQNVALLETIALSLKLPDTSYLVKTGERLRDSVISRIMQFIFKGQADGANNQLRQAQYSRIIKDWIKHPILESWLERIDDPQPFYPEEVISAIKNAESNVSVINILRTWHKQYLELTGPAKHLAWLLNASGQTAEAIDVLEQAQQHGFFEKGRRECTRLLKQLRIKQANDTLEGDKSAVDLQPFLELLDADDGDINLVLSVIALAVNQAKRKKDESCHERVSQAVSAWIDRARTVGSKPADEHETTATEDDIAKVLNNMDEALPQIFLAPFGELNDSTDWKRVAGSMDRLLAKYESNCAGHYWRMIAYNRLYSATDPSRDSATLKNYLKRADADAAIVLQCSPDPEKRKQASDLRLYVRDILNKL